MAMTRSSSLAATQAKHWYWQRISAMVLAVCVLLHLGVIIYAVRSGLSAAAILGRTHGSLLFGGFYVIFVLACAVHVPIGLGRIAEEWLGCSTRVAKIGAQLFGLLILFMGLRAVYGVVLA